MQRRRMDGLYLVLLGCAVFLLIGIALEKASPAADADFKLMYFSARCMLEHQDPYQESALKAMYSAEGGMRAEDMLPTSPVITKLIYLPTLFFFTTPFALLPYGLAHALWLTLTAGCLILAALAMWHEGAEHAPLLSGVLVGATLANSELFLVLGNPGGIVAGLCILAAGCIIRNRYALAGVAALAFCLMLKPHEAGPVWLFFLLAGGLWSRRALQTLALAAVLSVPTVLWVTSVVPNWPQELRAMVKAGAARGEVNDPGPTSLGSHGIGMVISAQAAFSLVRDEPEFYNTASYLLCGPLILAWCVRTWRVGNSARMAWFALAAISTLSMLPVYHRMYDARLMLLAVPACAILWASRGPRAWWAVAFSAASLFVTSAIPWALFLQLLPHLRLPGSLGSSEALLILQVVPVPLTLLATGMFYLWVYLRPGSVVVSEASSPRI